MIAAALLGALALQSAASPNPAASASAVAPATAAPRAYPCAPTVRQALESYVGKHRLKPDFHVDVYEGYAFVLYGVNDSGFAFSAWFQQRKEAWCVIATGGDAIGVPPGLPPRVVEQFMKQWSAPAPPAPHP